MATRNAKRLREAYELHRQDLYTYALGITRDPAAAEDAVHGAFAKLLNTRRLPNDIRPYVFRMVRNAAIDEKRRVTRDNDAIALLAKTNGHAIPPEQYARYLEIESAIAQLNDDERETIILKDLTGFTLREIAEIQDTSINTVASWYRRGLEKLRKILGDTQT